MQKWARYINMASASLSRESFNDAVENALEALSSIESLTKYQSKALFHVLNREDTFVSLPTGHGKSLIYQLALSVSKHLGLLSEVPIVLVISPLNALIDDQIASVTKLGITACKLDASSLEDTVSLAGHEILFTSPEVLETRGARKWNWRANSGGGIVLPTRDPEIPW